MIVRIFLAGFLSLGITFVASSQDISLYSGISHASMKDMKLLQEFIAGQVPVSYEFTDRFPVYWLYGFSARWRVTEKGKIGINAHTTSTGARSSYSDYSGKSNQDYFLRSFGLSTYYDYRIYEEEKFEAVLYSQIGIVSTRFDYEEYFQLGNQSTTESLVFNSVGIMMELGAAGKYFFFKKGFLEARIGYQFTQQAPLNDEQGNEIVIPNSNTIAADWSGFKLGLGIGIRF
jgi:hypothetical protein